MPNVKSILLVKTSSLGDVVHNLPVASDLRIAFPDATIDWVVEEAFDAVPRMHPAVREVMPVGLRRWRSVLWRAGTRAEIAAFARRLRQSEYDAVIDTQGLLKSALMARMARGVRYGLDWKSSREPLAVFYDRTFSVPWTLHAVMRNRTLASRALGYTAAPAVDYGVTTAAAAFPWLPAERYAVLLHATSAERKLWPESLWRELATYLMQRGIRSVLPWGNPDERMRSERLARGLENSIVAPALALDEVMGLLAGAQAVIGVDTGLTHLAAALGVPAVGIYRATDPARTGIYGCRRGASVGGVGARPSVAEVLRAFDRVVA